MKSDQEVYTESELDLFKKIEEGKYTSISKEELEFSKKKYREIASASLKRKPINIRILEKDIPRIKAMALSEGIPYQTFITSVLHKIATGKIDI